MTTATEADVNELQSEIKQLRADFAKVTETLQNLLRHGGAEAVGKAQDTAEKLWAEARSKAQGLTAEIEEKPVTAALTAFGIGVVLGMLFCGRRG